MPAKRAGGFAKRDAKRQRKSGLLGSSAKFRSAVRKEILRTTETKMRTSVQGVTSLYHNTWNSSSWLMNLPKGDGQEHRDGDEVFLRQLVTKLHFNTKPDRQSMTIRAMLIQVPSHHASTSANALFQATANLIIAFPDKRDMKVLAQKVVKLQGDTVWNSSDTVKKDLSATIVLTANFHNRRVVYDSADEPKDFAVRLLIAAYDAHGTLTTDNIADFMASSRLYYKDP